MTDWTIVIAGNGDAATAAERAHAMVRRLESEGHHISHGSCTTGDRRQVVYVRPSEYHRLTKELGEA